jgi:hypothetical protein
MIKPKILVTGATGRTGGAVGPRARYRLESSFQSVVGTGQLPLLIKGLRIRDGKQSTVRSAAAPSRVQRSAAFWR